MQTWLTATPPLLQFCSTRRPLSKPKGALLRLGCKNDVSELLNFRPQRILRRISSKSRGPITIAPGNSNQRILPNPSALSPRGAEFLEIDFELIASRRQGLLVV